jgi:hypothetical protein
MFILDIKQINQTFFDKINAIVHVFYQYKSNKLIKTTV